MTTTANEINILMADDDQDDCYFFEQALKKIAISTKLITVEDGEQLMNYLVKNKRTPPDILFLDINMPRKNGYECLEEIKSNGDIDDFPVIMYSTSLKDTMSDLLCQKGAHYYLRKCDFPDLVKHLQTILTLLQTNHLEKPSKERFVLNDIRSV